MFYGLLLLKIPINIWNCFESRPLSSTDSGISQSSISPKFSKTLFQFKLEYSSLNALAKFSMLHDIRVFLSSGSFLIEAGLPSLLDSKVL